MKEQLEIIKTSKINKIMPCIDYHKLKTSIIPIGLCFISWLVAITFLLSQYEPGMVAVSTFILVTVQLVSSINDIYNRTISTKLMVFSLLVGLAIFWFFPNTNTLINSILGGIIAFAILYLLMLLSKRQVGGGDLALMTVTGFFAGVNAFFSILFFSIVLSGMYSLFLVCTKKGDRNTEIPFAPFVLLGTVILISSGIR